MSSQFLEHDTAVELAQGLIEELSLRMPLSQFNSRQNDLGQAIATGEGSCLTHAAFKAATLANQGIESYLVRYRQPFSKPRIDTHVSLILPTDSPNYWGLMLDSFGDNQNGKSIVKPFKRSPQHRDQDVAQMLAGGGDYTATYSIYSARKTGSAFSSRLYRYSNQQFYRPLIYRRASYGYGSC